MWLRSTGEYFSTTRVWVCIPPLSRNAKNNSASDPENGRLSFGRRSRLFDDIRFSMFAWLPVERKSRAKRHSSSSRSEEHTSELQSLTNLVCRLLLEKKKN